MALTVFRSQLDRFIESLPLALVQEHVTDARIATLPGNIPPWHLTGILLDRGQSFSVFANGRIHWSAARPERYGGPKFHLWARVSPGGRILNLAQDTATFVADVAGELELGIYMGVWKNAYGDLATPPTLYQGLAGALECWSVAWRTSAELGLAALEAHQPNTWFITSERARLARATQTPPGWSYLLDTGTAEIFSAEVDSKPCIRIDADDDQGIITYPVDVPLTPHTRLSWRWRADLLPSAVAENTVHTHDYFSIATEFDNGRDLTWIWSSCLPTETHFHCPIKAWTPRETHFVARSGSAELGQWQTETREVFADVATAMGDPPAHIVRVWLIAVSSFQHQRARALFADIVLQTDEQLLTVL